MRIFRIRRSFVQKGKLVSFADKYFDQETLYMRTDNFLSLQFPYRMLAGEHLMCEWLKNSTQNFIEPFFSDTISRLRSGSENQQKYKCVASLQMLEGWAAGTGIHRQPTAIIFHVSRCGSTLLSQLLALQPQHMVLSEVPFFDELLRLPFANGELSHQETGALFDSAFRLYVNSSGQPPAHVFIKTDSWHLHFYETMRRLYPHVPFILLYRQPWEVIQSQQRRRGMQSVPGVIDPAIFGFTKQQAATYDLDQYMAQVLQGYFKKMIAIAQCDAHSLLINYNEGALVAMQKISKIAGIHLDDRYLDDIEQRAGYHGKYPGEIYSGDRNSNEPPEYLNPAIALYNQLEGMRLKAPPIESKQM